MSNAITYNAFLNVLHTVFKLRNYHRRHYRVVAVFLGKYSENESKLKDCQYANVIKCSALLGQTPCSGCTLL